MASRKVDDVDRRQPVPKAVVELDPEDVDDALGSNGRKMEPEFSEDVEPEIAERQELLQLSSGGKKDGLRKLPQSKYNDMNYFFGMKMWLVGNFDL